MEEIIIESHFGKAMNCDVLEAQILAGISGDRHFKAILPPVLYKRILNSSLTLSEILRFDSNDLKRLGIGQAKTREVLLHSSNLQSDKGALVDYFSKQVAVPVLPFTYNPDDDIVQSLNHVICDLITLFRYRNNKRIEIISCYYDFEMLLDVDQIARKYSITMSRVGQLLHEFRSNACLSMDGLATQERYRINKGLIDKIAELKSNCLWNASIFEYIVKKPADAKYISRLVELFGCALINVEDEYFLIDDSASVSKFREYHRALVQTMGRIVEPMTLPVLQKLIKRELKKHTVDPVLINSIIRHGKFEALRNHEAGDEKFQIKWEFLASLNLKAQKIAFEWNRAAHRNDLLKEYNHRLSLLGVAGIEDDYFFLRHEGGLKSLGNNMWKYDASPDKGARLSGKLFVEDFVKKQAGKVYFDQVKEALIKHEYSYPDNSIRAYILSCSKRTRENTDLFVHTDFVEKYPNLAFLSDRQSDIGQYIIDSIIKKIQQSRSFFAIRDVIDFVYKECQIEGFKCQKSQIKPYLIKLVEWNIAIFVDDTIALDFEQEIDLSKIRYRKEPTYKNTIRSLAINHIKTNNIEWISLSEIWDLFRGYYPDRLKKNNFYKIFNDATVFQKNKVGSKIYIKLLLELLPEPMAVSVDVCEPTIEEQLMPRSTEAFKRVSYNIDELNTQIRRELKMNFSLSDNIISIGLERFYQALRNNSVVSRWGDSLLQSIYELWFTKTDYYDREVCLIKLTTNYETYLKSLDPNLTQVDGLSTKIAYNPKLSELKSYKYEVKDIRPAVIDKVKQTYSYILGSMIYYRNIYSHDTANESLEMSMLNQIEYSTKFIALYVYTGYLLH